MTAIDRIRYLEMAIKESLRMHPAVPFTMRVATKPVNILGYDIPSQVSVWIQCLFCSNILALISSEFKMTNGIGRIQQNLILFDSMENPKLFLDLISLLDMDPKCALDKN
jgi:hypothetical protein